MKSPEKRPEKFSTRSLTGTARELILRVVDDGYEIDIIDFVLDAGTGMLMLGKSWSAIELDANAAKAQLAQAISLEVPVYPEDDVAAVHLERLHVSLMDEGFTTEREDSEQIRLRWTGSRAVTLDELTGDLVHQPSESVFPADVLHMITRLGDRERVVSEAVRIIATLRQATAELAQLLERDVRDEGGNPTAGLVHAEQQVLDWLDWLESNARIARDDLPGLLRPTGQVIIGRRSSLTPSDVARLRRRNATWQGSIAILTYDDLLDRGLNMLKLLTSGQ